MKTDALVWTPDGIMTTDEARFWKKVKKTATCWVWPSRWYGRFRLLDGRIVGAHRFSWELHNGPIPIGKDIAHRCDNKPCVNPSHIFVCSRSENLIDLWAKKIRTTCNWTKLEISEVLAIRKLLIHKSAREIASSFGVTPKAIRNIRNGKSWRYV